MPTTFHRDSLFTFLIFILPLFVLALVALYRELTTTITTTAMATKPSNNSLNVFKKPLALFSQSPMTGFYRDGYCRVGPEDGGNHAVAGMCSNHNFFHSSCFRWMVWDLGRLMVISSSGVLTKEFLDFSASRGNNLRSIGLEPGCKWCLCTARWKEAMEAAKGADDPVVPKYVLLLLFCTH